MAGKPQLTHSVGRAPFVVCAPFTYRASIVHEGEVCAQNQDQATKKHRWQNETKLSRGQAISRYCHFHLKERTLGEFLVKKVIINLVQNELLAPVYANSVSKHQCSKFNPINQHDLPVTIIRRDRLGSG